MAPFTGRMSAKNFSEGALVGPSSGPLALLNQLDPIRSVFSVPTSQFVQYAEDEIAKGQTLQPGSFISELQLPTGQMYNKQGQVSFVANEVDQATGTLPVYAQFPNPNGILVPGQFVTAYVKSPNQQKLPVVPVTAVIETKGGKQVYTVASDNTVKLQDIKTSVQTREVFGVTSGLKAGDVVVVEGLQKIKPGIKVQPVKKSGGPHTGSSANSSSSDTTKKGE